MKWRTTIMLLPALLLPLGGGVGYAQQTAPAKNTYYVDPAGNDAAVGGAGGKAAPWRTLQHAADLVKPGDRVIVHKGNYVGFCMGWDFPQGGTAAAPIVFAADEGAIITTRNKNTPDGINLERAGHIVISGFSIKNDGSIDRAGIRSVRNEDVVIRNNTIDHCGTWGIFTSYSERVTIENNTTSNSQKEHGIYDSNSADYPVIRGNRIFGNRDCGIHMNGDAGQGGDGIISHALVEDNIIYDNGTSGGSGINCDGVQDSIFRNNLLVNNHCSGISFYKITGAAGSTGNLVINNTVIMARDSRWAVNIKNGSTGNTIYDNILYNNNSDHGAINIAEDSLPGFISDYNIVDGRFSPNDNDLVRLSAWRSKTGNDQHSIQVSAIAPLFVNAAGGDFRLAPRGQAAGAGRTPPASATTLPATAGAARQTPPPQTWDMGARPIENAIPAASVDAPAKGGIVLTRHLLKWLLAWSVLAAGILLGGILAAWLLLRRLGPLRWLVSYFVQSRRRSPVDAQQEIHVLLCVTDHYEPNNGRASDERGDARVQRWTEQYPALYAQFRDADGRPPQHTFFYPIEQYNAARIEAIAALCREGYGEIEIHLHHDNDTAENLRKSLQEGKLRLSTRHNMLARDRRTGQLAYAFIHGDWALDNSAPDGRHCGVNNELDILRETGCYADFTLPSAPSPMQTSKINSIYYSVDDPLRPMSHNTGIDVGRAQRPANALMLIQGPLLLNWKRRKWGLLPRLENGCLQGNHPASMNRLDLWLKARVQVPQRPDWFFVKLHCHGANEDGQRGLLGPQMQQFHRDLAERSRTEPNFRYHYVTAREMYNLARAAEAGWTGSVNDARNFELISNYQELTQKKTA